MEGALSVHLPCSNADRSLAVLRCCFRWSPGWVGGGLSRRSAWIVIDDHAKRSFLHADKRSLITQLGINIPIRDMRLLDFNLLSSGVEMGGLLVSVLGRGVRAQSLHLPPPPTHTLACLPACVPLRLPAPRAETGKLLVRDNAIILSIEHVRLIISADKVLIPREGYEHNPLR